MPECQVSTGVFVLQQCSRGTQKQCQICSKYACKQHGHLDDTAWKCFECMVKVDADTRETLTHSAYLKWSKGEAVSDTKWYYFMRSNFFEKFGMPRFEESDFDEFDQDNLLEFQDDSDGGGLFDS